MTFIKFLDQCCLDPKRLWAKWLSVKCHDTADSVTVIYQQLFLSALQHSVGKLRFVLTTLFVKIFAFLHFFETCDELSGVRWQRLWQSIRVLTSKAAGHGFVSLRQQGFFIFASFHLGSASLRSDGDATLIILMLSCLAWCKNRAMMIFWMNRETWISWNKSYFNYTWLVRRLQALRYGNRFSRPALISCLLISLCTIYSSY